MQTRLYLLLALLLVFTTVNTGAHSKGIGLDCSVWNDHSLNELKSSLDKSFSEFMSIKVPESDILRTIKKEKERYLARGGTERMWQPPSRGVLRNRLRTKKYMKQYSRPLTDKEAYHFLNTRHRGKWPEAPISFTESGQAMAISSDDRKRLDSTIKGVVYYRYLEKTISDGLCECQKKTEAFALCNRAYDHRKRRLERIYVPE